MIELFARRPGLHISLFLAGAVALTAVVGAASLLRPADAPAAWTYVPIALLVAVVVAGTCVSARVVAVQDRWVDADLSTKYGRTVELLDGARARIDGVVRPAVYVPMTHTLIVDGRELDRPNCPVVQ